MFSKLFTVAALLSSALLVCASPTPPAPVDTDYTELTSATSLAQVITTCKTAGTAALTFDDGPEEYIYVSSLPSSIHEQNTDVFD